MNDLGSIKKLVVLYKWLAYPLGVFIFILLTFKFLIGEPGRILNHLTITQRSLAESEAMAARLQTKSSQLNTLDTATLQQDLAWLSQVTSADKQIDILIIQLKDAAALANGQLESFQTDLGEVASDEASLADAYLLTANFAIPTIVDLQNLVKALETSLPLIRIDSLSYAGTSASLALSGSWHPIFPVQTTIDAPLPETSQKITELKTALVGYSSAQVVSQDSSQPLPVFGINPDPFTLPAN